MMGGLSRKKPIVNIVWFKKDLRSSDHKPLSEAASNEYPVLPLYVFEPDYWEQKDMSQRHWEFTQQSLESLRQDLGVLGQALVFLQGNILEVFDQLLKRFEINAIYAHQETGNAWTYARDISVRSWARLRSIKLIEYQNNTIIRGLTNRDIWSSERDNFLSKPTLKKPYIRPIDAELSEISTRMKFKGSTVLKNKQIGGSGNGWRYLESFLEGRGNHYRVEMSSPLLAERACSRISPYLAYGNLSVREIFQFLNENHLKIKQMSPAIKSFKSRLAWKDHFSQKLEDDFSIEIKCLHKSFENLRPVVPDHILLSAWENGETGFPFLDACMRYLRATGWINFRMRAMLMSFASYHLWLDWRQSGQILAKFFTDYDPGIHWPQVQMQSGTTGINTFRMYNPIKQGIDQDPNATFIRKWVPELGYLSTAEIHKVGTENFTGDNIEKHYPRPVVDLAKAGREAREKVWAVRRLEGFKRQAKQIAKKHGSRQNRSRDFFNDRLEIKSKARVSIQKSFEF